ncbi:MAG: DUF4838 domain-containing protein [Clostridia bacterium]|nr:DUF4838 domain-containing protein [Clostridia bacterium]
MKISTTTANETVAFAATELRRYLSMMMPTGGAISLSLASPCSEGFRIGLMQDFSLDVSDVRDCALDDIIYMDTTENGGVIAGNNPRAVLLAVYEYLRQNGCRWLFPGPDGEFIPQKLIQPVKLRHVPSLRYRGWCNEGAMARQTMLDMIEFTPKVGMNVMMIQFRVPKAFYSRYYEHRRNQENFAPLSITKEQVMQWTSECECEAAKRGLQLHTMGHGFTIEPFGVDTSEAWAKISEDDLTPENREYLAMIDGKRAFFGGTPINTNFCMSNPKARAKVAEYITEYAKAHPGADYVHVWLADAHNNHCECDACRQKTPSDWYMILMNDIDAALSAKGLQTRIVFIAYVDTSWAPLTEKIQNPDRFTLMLAPITRNYTFTLPAGRVTATPLPYQHNNNTMPQTLDDYLAYYTEWKKSWSGTSLCYEYHFWQHQHYDPSGLALAKRIYEDVRVYKSFDIDGLIQCGSQRSFFPHGLAYYVHARTHFDQSLSFEEIAADYFLHAFGENYKEFLALFAEVEKAIPMAFMEGKLGTVKTPGSSRNFYNPALSAQLEDAAALADKALALVAANRPCSELIQSTSLRLVELFASFLKPLARFLSLKAKGEDAEAVACSEELRVAFGKHEPELMRYLDHWQCFRFIQHIAQNHYVMQ